MENINLTQSGIASQYDFIGSKIPVNPIVIIVILVISVSFLLLSSSLGEGWSSFAKVPKIQENSDSASMNFIEILMWGVFLFLIVTNMLQYFFEIDITTSIKNILTEKPEIDIEVKQPHVETVPEIKISKQVFHIPGNEYTFDDANSLCTAYGARLATNEEITNAHANGAEWCSYGWSKGQMALFPTQKSTFETLQKIPGHEHDCGRTGVNGGYIENPNVKFGVNCYGYKPKITSKESEYMRNSNPFPKTKKDIEFEKKVRMWKSKLPSIIVSPFNRDLWSKF